MIEIETPIYLHPFDSRESLKTQATNYVPSGRKREHNYINIISLASFRAKFLIFVQSLYKGKEDLGILCH